MCQMKEVEHGKERKVDVGPRKFVKPLKKVFSPPANCWKY